LTKFFNNLKDGKPSANGSIDTITTSSIDVESVGSSKDIQAKTITIEKWWQILIQVSIPFLIAGCGTIGAGVILGQVKVIRN
jgi:solute carrier family 41